jgi:hypothetical protein
MRETAADVPPRTTAESAGQSLRPKISEELLEK